MENTWLTVGLAAISSGAVWRLGQQAFYTHKHRNDLAKQLREELRAENQELRTEVKKISEQHETSREQYMELMSRFKILETEHVLNKKELERLREKLIQLEGYKDQAGIIRRIELELDEYMKVHHDPQRLVSALKKELANV